MRQLGFVEASRARAASSTSMGDAPLPRLETLHEPMRTIPLPTAQFRPAHVNRNPELPEEAVAWVRAVGTVDLRAPSSTLLPGIFFTRNLLCVIEHLSRAGLAWKRFTLRFAGGGSIPKFEGVRNLAGYVSGNVRALWSAVQALVLEGVPLEKALRMFTAKPAFILCLPISA